MGVLTDLMRDDIERLTDERDEARVEVERLRTALCRIVQCYPDDAMTAGAMRSIAERALAIASTPGGGSDVG